jgi:hypothetical protein
MTAELFVGAGVEIDAIAVADVDAERLAQKLDDGRSKRLHHRRPVDRRVQLRLEFLSTPTSFNSPFYAASTAPRHSA